MSIRTLHSAHQLPKSQFGSDPAALLRTRLGDLVELDENARAKVGDLFGLHRKLSSRQVLYSEGETERSMYIVDDGWLVSQKFTSDGRRQVLRTFVPGDIIGLTDLHKLASNFEVMAVESARVYPLKAALLEDVLLGSQNLNKAMFALMGHEALILADRAQSIGRMTAQERIIYYLIRLLGRLRITQPGITDTIRFPLSQTDLGDALGLTHTYVSKTLRELDKGGLITRHNHKITFLRENAMRELVDLEIG